jgi:hypothetical protein
VQVVSVGRPLFRRKLIRADDVFRVVYQDAMPSIGLVPEQAQRRDAQLNDGFPELIGLEAGSIERASLAGCEFIPVHFVMQEKMYWIQNGTR